MNRSVQGMRDNKNHVQRPGVLCPLSLWGGKWQMLMNLPLLFNPYLFFTLIRMHFFGNHSAMGILGMAFWNVFFLFTTCSHSGIVEMDVYTVPCILLFGAE